MCALAVSLAVSAADNDHAREIEQWRAARVAKLTKPDGWITLIGLHFLQTGANTIGAAKDNDVVLPKGPPRVGTVTVEANGRIVFEPVADAGVAVEGQSVARAELKWNVPANPTLVTFGTVSFFALDRAGRKALRVKDSASPRRMQFAGLEYFPLDPSWRIEARWEPFEKLRMTPIANILGLTDMSLVAGKAVFEREGRKFELTAIDEGPEAPLFFVITDTTAGGETYGGGRHLYVERPKDGARTIVLDFNRAENPPCAFTPFSSCPVPPKENRLPFPVRAGEKTYRSRVD